MEQGALASLAFAITVYYCAIGIAIDYYSDKLRIYLNLEHTMPRLARWIKYRRTLQPYSIGFNLSLLLLLAGYVAYVNILIFKDF